MIGQSRKRPIENLRLVGEQVERKWVVTSPDVWGLYVADSDIQSARPAAPAAIEMLERMAERGEAREQVGKRLADHG